MNQRAKRIVRRLLRRVGLTLASDHAFTSVAVKWEAGMPVHVDLRFKNGQRVCGYVDPWYPNKSPLRLAGIASVPMFRYDPEVHDA